MDYVAYIEEVVTSGTDMFWRTAKAIPADKLDWVPAGEARTARAIIKEVASITGATADMLKGRSVEAMGEDWSSDAEKSLEEMEAEHWAGLQKFLGVLKEFPESELQDGLDLPWGHMTFLQIIDYEYWNLMYHCGQIAYIQTMYGDKEMR